MEEFDYSRRQVKQTGRLQSADGFVFCCLLPLILVKKLSLLLLPFQLYSALAEELRTAYLVEHCFVLFSVVFSAVDFFIVRFLL